MRRRLPISLWLHVLAELWRVILLSTGVLVSVIAFAAAVKPLADGKIGPGQAFTFMLLASVPMLQYALPFAAGFGATLAYHRLAHDNELIGAHAGGISHRAILAPALFTGLALGCILLALNQRVIPLFLRSMEQMIAQDVTKLLVNSIARGESVRLDRVMIHADSAVRIDPAPGSAARDEILLTRVGAVETDREGRVRSDATAGSARVWVFDADHAPGTSNSGSLLFLRLERVFARGEGERTSGDRFDLRLRVPGGFTDDPKFLTYSELRRLRHEPERMNWIELRRRDLAFAYGERLTTEAVVQRLSSAGSVDLRDGDGRTLTVRATGLRPEGLRWSLVARDASAGIDVVVSRPGESPAQATTLRARTAGLYTNMGGPEPERRDLTINLRLEGVRALGRASEDAPSTGERSRLDYAGLRLIDGPVEPLLDRERTPSGTLLGLVLPRISNGRTDAFIERPYRELRDTTARLMREITSKQHERFAMAAACCVMVVTGALIAAQLSQSLPLTVYLWSFFPALAAVITISSGQQLTHDFGRPGLLVLWGAVAAMAAYGAVAFVRLARH